MIGNDIVDLDLAAQESDIHRKGFRDKLFLPHERDMIENAVHLWLLWSCKEAVYKIIHRNTHERKFAPQQFAVAISHHTNTTAAGIVTYQQQSYYFNSSIIGAGIHTVAAVSEPLLQEAAVFTRYHAATDNLQQILSAGEVFYKDEYGIPFIRHRYTGKKLPVSLSHHGKYIGMVKMPG